MPHVSVTVEVVSTNNKCVMLMTENANADQAWVDANVTNVFLVILDFQIAKNVIATDMLPSVIL